jgi:hypothetical protein
MSTPAPAIKFKETTEVNINQLWIDAALAAANGGTDGRLIPIIADIITVGYKQRVTQYWNHDGDRSV